MNLLIQPQHWLILPIVLPLGVGALLLMLWRAPPRIQRLLNLAATLALLGVALVLLFIANTGMVQVYLVGDWPAPYGIVLVLDRLAALMLALTAVLALFALLYALGDGDRAGRQFHALFQFQLLGLNGAFLTGDLFNLFVFFEILLIASYGLLLHGGGGPRSRAALHYVAINLIGSLLFLMGLGALYAASGTLNMADLALRLPALSAADARLASVAGLLLIVVFGLKAALLPLHFWLPFTYAAASGAVAALFAIMTKVGVYALVRLLFLVGDQSSALAFDWLSPGLIGVALATLTVGSLGAMASNDLREMVAYLVIVSVGTLVVGIALGSAAGVGAALYYLVHTTLVTAGLFLLADVIGHDRPRGTRIGDGYRPHRHALLGAAFLLAAVAVAGMPPLSGMVGKLLLLIAAREHPAMPWIWTLVLLSSLLLILALTRAGMLLFWRGPVATAAPPDRLRISVTLLLLASSPLLVIVGGPLSAWTLATAAQTLHPELYIDAVRNQAPVTIDRHHGPPGSGSAAP